MLISPKYKLIFVHIPKTGGNAVARMLKSKDQSHWIVGSTHIGLGLLQRTPKDYTAFAVFRHPHELYVSDYEWRKSLGKAEGDFKQYFYKTVKTPKFKLEHYLDGACLYKSAIIYNRLWEGLSMLMDEKVWSDKTKDKHYLGDRDPLDYYDSVMWDVMRAQHKWETEFFRHNGDKAVVAL